MNQQFINSRLELLVNLDSKTKCLISKIERIHETISSVKVRREKLDEYQTQIRENLVSINTILDELQLLGREIRNSASLESLQEAVANNRKQLLALQESYRKAIFTSSSLLETVERDELINRSSKHPTDNMQSNLEEEFQNSIELTQEMTTYARLLANEVQRGSINAELVESSSSKISSNYTELKDMSGHLSQSKRLTSLAHRRRITERIFFFLAFSFFFLSCGTIFLHRAPMGSWLLPSR